MTKFDFLADEFAPGVSPGFHARDLWRFFLVDLIIILSVRLLVQRNIVPGFDSYVILSLFGKIVLAVYLIFLVSSRPAGWQCAGVSRAGRLWAYPLSLAILAAALPLILRLDLLNIDLLTRLYAYFGFLYEPTPQDASIVLFGDLAAHWVRITLLVFAVLIGPILEELAFRGVGVDGYGKTGGLFRTVFWTSLLFSLYHFDAARVIPLMVLGVVFALARVISGSFWCSVFIHIVYNVAVLYIMARSIGYFNNA